MELARFITVAMLVLSLVAGTAAILRLTRYRTPSQFVAYSPSATTSDSRFTLWHQQPESFLNAPSERGWRDNILVLPQAATDFAGYWGGYIHSAIRRLRPDLIGISPDRVSVIFGREGDTIFMASELYGSPKQKILHRPKARMLNTRTAIVEYESTDSQLHYICSDRFQLNDDTRISYRSEVDTYDRISHTLIGVVTGRATLKRLRTLHEQHEFAMPSRLEVPRAAISASANLSSH